MMAGTYVPIQSVTLSTSAASVTFSGIPQTFTDLVVRFSVRTDSTSTGDYGYLYFNSDGTSTSNYSTTRLDGYGSSAASSRRSNWWAVYEIPLVGNGATANTFGSAEFLIPNYSSTANRPVSGLNVDENNGTSGWQISAMASLYRGAAAITGLTLNGNGVNFVAGSTFHLYGIKNS